MDDLVVHDTCIIRNYQFSRIYAPQHGKQPVMGIFNGSQHCAVLIERVLDDGLHILKDYYR